MSTERIWFRSNLAGQGSRPRERETGRRVMLEIGEIAVIDEGLHGSYELHSELFSGRKSETVFRQSDYQSIHAAAQVPKQYVIF